MFSLISDVTWKELSIFAPERN